jgi:hypothetical protein
MLTFHHSFSTRIFPAPATEYRSQTRSVILSGAKDPAGRRLSHWILRSAQNDTLRGANDGRYPKSGGAHAR